MENLVKKIISQKLINSLYHAPKAFVASVRYKFPSRKLTVIGVTGTDGKTTTVNMIYQMLKNADKKVSMISTINAVIAGKEYDTGFHVTSPDPFTVQKLSHDAMRGGDEYLVLEVTSHALDQHRFLGVKFDIGVITNITHDHLDYHKNKENLFLTKAKLIRKVKIAILNRDEKHFNRLSKLSLGRVISFGFSKYADYNPQKFSLNLKIPGKFNYLNALASASVGVSLGLDKKVIKNSLNNFRNLKGRLEGVKSSNGIKVIVDFAHTPNALKNVLELLRQDKKGRLISVFGAAGKRDSSKRALMGAIASKLSDFVVITAEDPRGELEEINKQILSGAVCAGGKLNENVFVINDRKEAIGFAINSLAKAGDTVGIFGKGHETSMNLDGKTEIPWSDIDVATAEGYTTWKTN